MKELQQAVPYSKRKEYPSDASYNHHCRLLAETGMSAIVLIGGGERWKSTTRRRSQHRSDPLVHGFQGYGLSSVSGAAQVQAGSTPVHPKQADRIVAGDPLHQSSTHTSTPSATHTRYPDLSRKHTERHGRSCGGAFWPSADRPRNVLC